MPSTNQQNLCVIASPHYTYSDQINIQMRVWDILDVRLKVIEAVARTMGEGCFFSDGVTAEAADFVNAFQDLGVVRSVLMSVLHSTSEPLAMPNYEHLRMAEVLCKLRDQKRANFWHAKTEDKFPKLLYHELGIIPPISGAESEPVAFEPKRPFDYPVPEAVLDARDENMIRSVQERGFKNNILFVGSRHQLKGLSETNIAHFRIEVAALQDGRIGVFGAIPPRYWGLMYGMERTTYTQREIALNLSPLKA